MKIRRKIKRTKQKFGKFVWSYYYLSNVIESLVWFNKLSNYVWIMILLLYFIGTSKHHKKKKLQKRWANDYYLLLLLKRFHFDWNMYLCELNKRSQICRGLSTTISYITFNFLQVNSSPLTVWIPKKTTKKKRK